MRYFMCIHLMPWEIDDFLVLARKLKRSYYYLDKKNTYTLHVQLNLSNALIDWNKSKLDKDFFIEKYYYILQILENSYILENVIYDEDEPVGHLDMERELYKRHNEYDAILSLCSDIHMHDTLLSNMFSGFEIITNEYSIITPQTHKLWDPTWDEMVNKNCTQFGYENWREIDVYDIEWVTDNNIDDISLYTLNKYKWAGWCDLKSSKLVEKFPPPDSWTGYGPYDLYLMLLLYHYKSINQSFDFKQYVIKNQVIGKYSNYTFKQFYKDRLTYNSTKPMQRKTYENEINSKISEKLNKLREGK